MGDDVLVTPAPVEKTLVLGEHLYGMTLFDISAAFPSVCWAWLWAVIEALRLPVWGARSVRGLMEGFEA